MNDGQLAVLNVGHGDTKLTFDADEAAEHAAKVIKDMIRMGYAVMVRIGHTDAGEPLYQSVSDFDPATREYLLKEQPKKRGGKGGYRRVKATETAGVAIAPRSGG